MISDFIKKYDELFWDFKTCTPWELLIYLNATLDKVLDNLPDDFDLEDGVAIHKSAFVEKSAIVKGPAYIGPQCYIGSNTCLRGGVFFTNEVKIGNGCEVKSSIIFDGSALAHFNFVGDSIIGSNVNFEAGSIVCNHYNERVEKSIIAMWEGTVINTNVTKFGALVGDNTKVGANAVLSPGTILHKDSIIKRLQLIEQNPLFNE